MLAISKADTLNKEWNIKVYFITFYKFSITVIIPDGVTSIGNWAFRDCSNLKSVIISNSVTNIKEYAFRNCSSLESVTISDSVTSIEGWVFEGCKNLKSVTIPDSVTSVEWGAFVNYDFLKSLTIYGVEVDLQSLMYEYSVCEATEELDLIFQRNFDELEERNYLNEENHDAPDGIYIDDAYSIIAEMFKVHPKDEKIVAFINKNFEKIVFLKWFRK